MKYTMGFTSAWAEERVEEYKYTTLGVFFVPTVTIIG